MVDSEKQNPYTHTHTKIHLKEKKTLLHIAIVLICDGDMKRFAFQWEKL